jgi:hypothetical protein
MEMLHASGATDVPSSFSDHSHSQRVHQKYIALPKIFSGYVKIGLHTEHLSVGVFDYARDDYFISFGLRIRRVRSAAAAACARQLIPTTA